MRQQKSTLFDKLDIVFFKARTFSKSRTSNDLSVETIGYLKRNWGKKWHEVQLVYNKGVKVSELSLFSTT